MLQANASVEGSHNNNGEADTRESKGNFSKREHVKQTKQRWKRQHMATKTSHRHKHPSNNGRYNNKGAKVCQMEKHYIWRNSSVIDGEIRPISLVVGWALEPQLASTHHRLD